MKTQTYLHIYNPCNENWNKMTLLEQGKFCDKCAHEVMDFTVMTDQEVLNYIKNNNGMTCGRLHLDQLQRALHDMDRKKKKGWQWVIAGMASLFFSIGKSSAQKNELKEESKAGLLLKNNDAIEAQQNLLKEQKTLKGRIFNDNQQAILNGYVLNPTTLDKILVNKNGEFVMQVTENITHVLAGAKGYDSRMVPTNFLVSSDTTIELKRVDTSITDSSGIGNLDLNTKNVFMGGITTFTEIEKPDTLTTFVKKVFNNSFFKIIKNPANKNGVSLSVKQEGRYNVQIFDNNSKLIQVTEIEINSKNEVVFIDFTKCVAKGIYYIRLVDKKTGKQYTDKIVVQ